MLGRQQAVCMSWWWFLRWVLSRLSLSLWSEALSFQKVSVWLIFLSARRPQRQLVHYLPAIGVWGAQGTSDNKGGSGARSAPGLGFPCDWALPPFLPSPYLPRTLLPIPVQEKPSCYIFSPVFPPPHFLFFFYLLMFFPFLFSRRPLRSSWCFTSDSTFGENQWGLDYSWPLFFTCSWRDFANAIYKVGSLPLSPYNHLISLFRSLGTSITLFCFALFFPRGHCLLLFTRFFSGSPSLEFIFSDLEKCINISVSLRGGEKPLCAAFSDTQLKYPTSLSSPGELSEFSTYDVRLERFLGSEDNGSQSFKRIQCKGCDLILLAGVSILLLHQNLVA